MRTPSISSALLLLVTGAAAIEPPQLPAELCVAGANIKATEVVKPVVPRFPTASGEYVSHSITDGRQWVKLQVRPNGAGGWQVDGVLKTSYSMDPPETLKFSDAPIQVGAGRAWFETGLPGLVGHFVLYRPMPLGKMGPAVPWQAGVVMSDSVYKRHEDKARPLRPYNEDGGTR